MTDKPLDWKTKLGGPTENENHDHAADAREVYGIIIHYGNDASVVDYSYIRRTDLFDGVIFINASELIFQIVSDTPHDILTRLQQRSLHQLKVGELGITHITTKLNDDASPVSSATS